MMMEHVEANESCDEMPEPKRRKVSDESEPPLDLDSMKVQLMVTDNPPYISGEELVSTIPCCKKNNTLL